MFNHNVISGIAYEINTPVTSLGGTVTVKHRSFVMGMEKISSAMKNNVHRDTN